MPYAKAPIKEALFDIRIDKLKIEKVEDLKDFEQFVKESYPKSAIKNQFKGGIKITKDKAEHEPTVKGIQGYIFSNESKTRLMQIEETRFTYNVLDPYETWDIHFEEFWKYWSIYRDKFQPNNVVSIATKFTNRIKLQLPFDDFDEYMTCMPPIPKTLPQVLQALFMQVQVPMQASSKNVTITQTMEPINKDVLPFILDITVHESFDTDKDFDSFKGEFQEMREIKNKVFEDCITDKTRNLFI